MPESSQPQLGQESVPDDEDVLIARLIRAITETQRASCPVGQRPMRRDAHAKHHGIVRGELSVEADLPAELAVGVFAAPRTYPTYVRFSNGEGAVKSDAVKDVRGVAIKLFGVPGPKLLEEDRDASTQDFIFVTHHSFPLRNLRDYADVFEMIERGENPVRFFFGWNPRRWRIHEARTASAGQIVLSNPLTVRYWSAVPFAYGPGRAAKFSIRPHRTENSGAPPRAGDDYLREGMARTLAQESAEFDFLVQLQTDPVKMPLRVTATAGGTRPWGSLDYMRQPSRRVHGGVMVAIPV